MTNCSFLKFSVASILLLLALVVRAEVTDSLRTEKRGSQWFVIHKVESGETLFSLSRRYKSSVEKIVDQNKIENNSIDIGQELAIPISAPKQKVTRPSNSGTSKTHTVAAGETLFAISRKYGASVADIKKWNGLTTNNLDIGQVLKLQATVQESQQTSTVTVKKDPPPATNPPFAGAKAYRVVAGDGLALVGRKLKVSVDSLKQWNQLSSSNLSIGQTLWYRKFVRSNVTSNKEEVFGKKRDEGLAMQIQNLEGTTKYLALHPNLPVGTLVEVTNLMNKRKVFVRVVGKLPNTSENDGVLIRLTPISFKRLGIIDDRARVELAYYDE